MTRPEDRDIVIPVRPGARNEELRFALRSIEANMPHRRVWLFGFAPPWVDRGETYVVERTQRGDKHANSMGNLLTSCRHPGVSEEFTLWMDDVFVLRPLPAGAEVLHRGPLENDLARLKRAGAAARQHRAMLEATAWMLSEVPGQRDRMSYELHAPFPTEKRHVLSCMEAADHKKVRRPQIRTLVGNMRWYGGKQVEDFKHPDNAELSRILFVSTSDRTFQSSDAGKHVRALFPKPSRFEKGAK